MISRNAVTATTGNGSCPMCRDSMPIKVTVVEGGQPITVVAVNGGAPVLDEVHDGESVVVLPAGVTGESEIVIRPSGNGEVEVTLCANAICNRAVLSVKDSDGQPAAADIDVGGFRKSGPISRGGLEARCYHTSPLLAL